MQRIIYKTEAIHNKGVIKTSVEDLNKLGESRWNQKRVEEMKESARLSKQTLMIATLLNSEKLSNMVERFSV
ncbi:hypothetical protein [Clostridium thermopalmarium]|jgi:hypothetical protein|uniref:Uncharacterized protein n=2 Tax=Clostridium TaxID=1485 RepID=A0A151ANI2_9CLOT|nr:hypothetical protein [Clostridium thermopalmarium]KYH29183.1 hypothetical protein CLCOL_13200 [Clostridium colicanis DSM 13634]PRR69132.1 hypothetical protein CPAL_26500 [Clostridium thermopalmarium DSM 5974]PVZ26517.1 hypothetical protein LX19_00591 [Clostridium thermopalmarium DSM 5974]